MTSYRSDLDVLLLRQRPSLLVRVDVECDHHRPEGVGEHDVGVVDPPTWQWRIFSLTSSVEAGPGRDLKRFERSLDVPFRTTRTSGSSSVGQARVAGAARSGALFMRRFSAISLGRSRSLNT